MNILRIRLFNEMAISGDNILDSYRLSPLWGSLFRYYNFLYIINIGYACIRISLLSRGY
jgi:hypothetical protein